MRIPVTKPFLPPIEEYQHYLEGIWKREFLTNNGPLVQKLEEELKKFLRVDKLLYMSNGTIALQIAIKALDLKGEIITTPFSYVATTSSIVWEGCKPVFVDIDSNSLNINPELIEQAITEQTTGILATHVFGNPCEIDVIKKIADQYGLKVIYDAAHCFGSTYKGKSVFSYGDVNTSSFHATKLFHTIEGGAIFTQEDDLFYRMSQMRTFGHAGYDKFDGVGINGKNSEYHAAMGLCNLKYIQKIMKSRDQQFQIYQDLLGETPIKGIKVQQDSTWNHSYYPVIFKSEEETLNIKNALEECEIYPRRYFYPSLDSLDYVRTEMVPVSKENSERILCLPMYYDLKFEDQKLIADTIIKNLSN